MHRQSGSIDFGKHLQKFDANFRHKSRSKATGFVAMLRKGGQYRPDGAAPHHQQAAIGSGGDSEGGMSSAATTATMTTSRSSGTRHLMCSSPPAIEGTRVDWQRRGPIPTPAFLGSAASEGWMRTARRPAQVAVVSPPPATSRDDVDDEDITTDDVAAEFIDAAREGEGSAASAAHHLLPQKSHAQQATKVLQDTSSDSPEGPARLYILLRRWLRDMGVLKSVGEKLSGSRGKDLSSFSFTVSDPLM